MVCMSRAIALVALAALFACAPAADRKRLNVVVVLVDDLGWQDTSVDFGAPKYDANRQYRTPNLERLAREGVRFTNAHACTVCTPSRVSLMTGVNAARHGVTNWTRYKNAGPGGLHPRLRLPAWNANGLQPDASLARGFDAPTLAQRLSDAGYRTIHVGKAHFGALGTAGADPRELGFRVNIAGHAMGAPGSHLGVHDFSGAWQGYESIWDVPGLERYHGEDVTLAEVLTREAVREIEAATAAGEPFFLYLAHYAVHVPIEPARRFVQRYLELGLDPIEAAYASMVEDVDASLGEILAALERLGVAQDTLVVFTSDNGGLTSSQRGGDAFTHNAPLRSGKGSAYEGGTRVPLVVRWPGVALAGARCDAPTMVEDLCTTVLAAGALAEADAARMDGRDLSPLLREPDGAALDARALVWHFPHVWDDAGPGIEPYSAIQVGDWKLIVFHDGPRAELYDLAHDLGETHDLAAEQPEKRRELALELRRILTERGARMPALADGRPLWDVWPR